MPHDSFRKRSQLIKELQKTPPREDVEKAFEHLRGKHRMPSSKQTHMSRLLAKASEAALSAEESWELDGLIEEYEKRTLELVQDVSRTVARSPRNSSNDHRDRGN